MANWRQEPKIVAALMALAGAAVVGAGFFYVYDGDSQTARQLVRDLYALVGVALVSVGATVALITRGVSEMIAQQKKEELIQQLGGPDRNFTLEAVRMLRQRGWLEDGTLAGARLSRTNLEEARLYKVNLRSAQLNHAKLRGADLWEADLREADVWGADLQQADLVRANMSKGNFWEADFREAHLWGANLEGADLREVSFLGADLVGVNLTGANLWRANMLMADLERATLPDGTTWEPERDLREFTHPENWNGAEATQPLEPDAPLIPPPEQVYEDETDATA